MSINLQATFKSPDSRLGLLLALLFFLLPFGQHLLVNISLAAILLHSLLSLKARDWSQALKSPLFLLPVIFLAFHLLSILWATDTSEGFFALKIKLDLVFIPLVIVANRKWIHSKIKDKLLWAFIWGNVGASLFAFGWAAYRVAINGGWYWTTPGSDYKRYYFLYENLSEPIMHPGYLSTYIGFALLICIYFLILKKGNRVLLSSLLLFLFFTLIMLQGRINIVAFFAVVGISAFILAIMRKAYKWLLVPLIPVLFLAIFLLLASHDTRERYFELPDMSYDISGDSFNSATFRLAEWLCASDVIREHPIVGTGLGDSHSELLKSYAHRKFYQGLEHKFNAHNQYLETTLATGIIGLALLLVFLSGYGWLAYRQKNYLALSCLLFFALSMLTESMLERVWAVNLLACFFGAMLVSPKQEQLD